MAREIKEHFCAKCGCRIDIKQPYGTVTIQRRSLIDKEHRNWKTREVTTYKAPKAVQLAPATKLCVGCAEKAVAAIHEWCKEG